jgi:hypothetical protein
MFWRFTILQSLTASQFAFIWQAMHTLHKHRLLRRLGVTKRGIVSIAFGKVVLLYC